MNKDFLKPGHKISWYLQKRCFARKKVSYWKNPPFWKIQNLFFMDLRFRNWSYIQTSFQLKNHHATSSSQARCFCRIFVNLIFINCHYNNDQMIFLSNRCPIERLHIDKKMYLICSLLLRHLILTWFTKIRQTHLAWLEEVAWCFLSRKLVDV